MEIETDMPEVSIGVGEAVCEGRYYVAVAFFTQSGARKEYGCFRPIEAIPAALLMLWLAVKGLVFRQ